MVSLVEIEQRMEMGELLEDISCGIDWKEFEELTAEILISHDFKIKKNFRFKTSKRYEIDILAKRGNIALAVDCKHWNMGRYKKSPLKQAVERQIERVKELNTSTLIYKNVKPIIVTLFQEELTEHQGIFIMPVWKLNEFLLNIGSYP